MKTKTYSTLDHEVIVLAAIWDLIGSMVHYGHFEKQHRLHEAQLAFRNSEASKVFLIVLADFLSLPRPGTLDLTKPGGSGARGATYLGLLNAVVGNPCLGGNPADLAGPLEVFADWLDGYAEVEEVWLPSIERNGPMRVQRMAYLKICGTISKHGITRLGGIVREIQKILSANGTEVDEGQAYLVVPEFQEWFQDHVFQYQATSIACFLNNIRWGIFEYLAPEFHRAFRPTWRRGILEAYRYELPAEIANPLIVSMYWDLLNHVRTEPYFPRFTVSPYLVGRY